MLDTRLTAWRNKRSEGLAEELKRALAPRNQLPAPRLALESHDQLIRLIWRSRLHDASVADPFNSMGDFWMAYSQQQEGRTLGTIWDSYESGYRRVLEHKFANVFGAESAVLVNSGMAAIFASVYSGCRFSAPSLGSNRRRYFESTELFESLSKTVPDSVTFIEPVVNSFKLEKFPRSDVPAHRAVIDNSMHSTRLPYSFFAMHLARDTEFLIVESLSKYVTNAVSAGIVYGSKVATESVRSFARMSGIQLAYPAAAAICQTDIELNAERVALHTLAAKCFVAALDLETWDLSTPFGDGLFPINDTGALVYLRPRCGSSVDHVVDRWVRASAAAPPEERISVRAGYGWPLTTVRAYSSTTLNQADADEYIRISVGLVSSSTAHKQASALNRALKEERK